ncbi:hypothetical protein Tco_1036179 [Tanacetum coccineum]
MKESYALFDTINLFVAVVTLVTLHGWFVLYWGFASWLHSVFVTANADLLIFNGSAFGICLSHALLMFVLLNDTRDVMQSLLRGCDEFRWVRLKLIVHNLAWQPIRFAAMPDDTRDVMQSLLRGYDEFRWVRLKLRLSTTWRGNLLVDVSIVADDDAIAFVIHGLEWVESTRGGVMLLKESTGAEGLPILVSLGEGVEVCASDNRGVGRSYIPTRRSEYIQNTSIRRSRFKRRYFEDYCSDNQYAIFIKEDTAYLCMHSPKTMKETKSNTPYPGKAIRRIQAIWE